MQLTEADRSAWSREHCSDFLILRFGLLLFLYLLRMFFFSFYLNGTAQRFLSPQSSFASFLFLTTTVTRFFIARKKERSLSLFVYFLPCYWRLFEYSLQVTNACATITHDTCCENNNNNNNIDNCQQRKAINTSKMGQLAIVKDQLLSQGLNHFVILSSSGDVVDASGDFCVTERQRLAFTILQQCGFLLGQDEKLKRLSMTFSDTVYVASTVTDGDDVYGVLVKRMVANMDEL